MSASTLTTSTNTEFSNPQTDVLPEYSCSVEYCGTLALRCELTTPFLESGDNKWHEVFVVLRGPQLNFHKFKSSTFSKGKPPAIGRLMRSYTLQHAEVGVATDWRKGELVPKSPFAKIVPAAARQKLWETDPALFEPVREWVIRLRLETEQLLLCAPNQDLMLSWVECLCAAMDIAQPLEDRSEPRYRSLPRRNRRQREIEGVLDHLDNLPADEVSRRFIEQQERLIRRLYPHLARESSSAENQADPGSRYPTSTHEHDSHHGASQEDPEADDLDPADVTEGSPLAHSEPIALSSNSESPAPRTSESEGASDTVEPEPFDPKTAPPREPPSYSAQLRYRKRCAPVLLSSSPRASEVIFCRDRRMRIDATRSRLVPFEMSPPRYDSSSSKTSTQALAAVAEDTSLLRTPSRPTMGERGTSDVSHVSANTTYSFDEEFLHASGDIGDLHTNGSSSDHAQSSHLDGSNDLRIHRIESHPESVESAPPSPVPSDTAGKIKGKSILSVWRLKVQHSTNADLALQNPQIPLVL